GANCPIRSFPPVTWRRRATAILRHFFDAAALPISLKRMAATPFARCPGQKSKLGRVKVSITSAVDYETFPGQEYICTEKPMETYLCEKLIF
ncbi:MAG: hypothetical protein VXU42_03010, partial [Verrucomicrobiota bacterium]|nr:hypothetical protein [Verrucomicrobiota bacterium]